MDKLSVSTFIKGKTPEKIAKLYEELDLNSHVDIKEQNRKLLLNDQPLSVTQNIFLNIQQTLSNSSTMYNLPILLKFKDVDFKRLKKAIDIVLKAHPVFSCVYVRNDDGTFVHKYDINKKFDIKIENVTEKDFEIIKNTIVQPFNLFGEPLYRIRLFKIENKGFLFFDFHHSIADGTSINIFLDDINKAYDGLPLEDDYYFIALDERQKESTSVLYSEASEYYNKIFSGCDWTNYIPFDYDIGENKYGISTIDVPIGNSVFQEIYNKYGVGKNAFFITAAGIALSIACKRNNVMICWTYNGRNTLAEKRTIGAMLKVFYVGLKLDNKKTIKEIYHIVAEQIKNNIFYSCNMETALKYAPPEGELNINFLQNLKDLESKGSLSWIVEDMTQTKEYADNLLDLGILDGNDGCKLLFEYNACKYKEETMEKFKLLFVKIAVALAENSNNPNVTLEEIFNLHLKMLLKKL